MGIASHCLAENKWTSVIFLYSVHQDFATPSLNMSEESPSKAILLGNARGNGNGQQQDIPELAAFQLRRRWESRYVYTSIHLVKVILI